MLCADTKPSASGDTLDIIKKVLTISVGASLAQTFTSLVASSHVDSVVLRSKIHKCILNHRMAESVCGAIHSMSLII